MTDMWTAPSAKRTEPGLVTDERTSLEQWLGVGLDFDDLEGADAAADLEAFRTECQAARDAVAGRSLDDVVPSRGDHPERVRNVRWLYVHMIEEHARHNGHADLLREAIDGVTGD